MTFSLPGVRALPRWSPCLFRDEGAAVGDKRTYRKFTAEQKLELVLAGLGSGKVAEVL
jgi:hypothetical protein